MGPLEDSFTFAVTINNSNLITVLNLPTTNFLYPGLDNDYHVSTFTKLESLQATVRLFDFAKAPMPETSFRDTDAEKQAKLAEMYDRFEKVGLKILINGVERSMPVLQNRGNESYLPLLNPYLCMTEVQLLGKNDAITMQITDLDDGVLGANDSLIIQGSYVQVRNCIPKVIAVANLTYSGVYTP